MSKLNTIPVYKSVTFSFYKLLTDIVYSNLSPGVYTFSVSLTCRMSRSQEVFGRRVVCDKNIKYFYTITFIFVYPATILGKFWPGRGCLLKSDMSSGYLACSCRGRLLISIYKATRLGHESRRDRLHNSGSSHQ